MPPSVDMNDSTSSESGPAQKAVSFDLFKNDCFSNKKAPPRALLERLNHPVALSAKELREKREKDKDKEDEAGTPGADGEGKPGAKAPKRPARPATLRPQRPKKEETAAEGEGDPLAKSAELGPDDGNASSPKKEVVTIGVGIGIEDQSPRGVATLTGGGRIAVGKMNTAEHNKKSKKGHSGCCTCCPDDCTCCAGGCGCL